MSASRMRKSADVGRRTEPRTDRRGACAQGACTKVPTSSGGRATQRSTRCMRTRRMHKSADVKRQAEPRTARRNACAR
eukprot:1177122-Pleurochrysis_carterae.AAC.1